MRTFVCLFLFFCSLFVSQLGLAQCDCPPVEIVHEEICGGWGMTLGSSKFHFTGGCAEAEDSSFIVAQTNWSGGLDTIGSFEPYETISVGYTGFTVTVHDADCTHSFDIPVGAPQLPPCKRFFDCETGQIAGLPEYTYDADTIGQSGAVEGFSLTWTDVNNCPHSAFVVAVCDIQDCPEANLTLIGEPSINIVNCTESATFRVEGTIAAQQFDSPEGPGDCQAHFPHSYEINGEPINYSDVTTANGPYLHLTYPSQMEPIEIQILDNLSNCIDTVQIQSQFDCENICNCDNFEVQSTQVCSINSNIIDATYVFSNECTLLGQDVAIEVSYQGVTFIIEDSLFLQHELGEEVIFSEVIYRNLGNTICSTSFDLGPADCLDNDCYCPPIEMSYEVDCNTDVTDQILINISFQGGCPDGSLYMSGDYNDNYLIGDTLNLIYDVGATPYLVITDNLNDCQEFFVLPEVHQSYSWGMSAIDLGCPPMLPEMENGTYDLTIDYPGGFWTNEATFTTDIGCSSNHVVYAYCEEECLDLETTIIAEYEELDNCEEDFLRVVFEGILSARLGEISDSYDIVLLLARDSLDYEEVYYPFYYEFSYLRSEGVDLHIIDQLADCSYQYSIAPLPCASGLCSCDNFEVTHSISCLVDGSADVTFIFSRTCPGPMEDGSIEVSSRGETYLLTNDSLSLNFEAGSMIELDEVIFTDLNLELCRRSYDFGVLDCSVALQDIEHSPCSIQSYAGRISLRCPTNDQQASLFVYDSLGRLISNELVRSGAVSIPTDLWASGIYHVQLRASGSSFATSVFVD